MHRDPTAPRELLPDEVRYLDTADPSAFADLYFRHRDGVRAALESNGLSRYAAECLVGEVFTRLMDQRAVIDRSRPLSETLASIARTVSREPLGPDTGRGLGPRANDGFYGSGL